jgi:hypothetical protein
VTRESRSPGRSCLPGRRSPAAAASRPPSVQGPELRLERIFLRSDRLVSERSLAHLRCHHHAATDEAEIGMIEIVTLEIGDRRANAPVPMNGLKICPSSYNNCM